ncbi:MAG: hypothetical protein JXR37_20340 [Kiritimatiellae bacterium]|nr:hypothetical protein [Kiritimatiellia bacterium]
MTEWWNGLTTLNQVFYGAAVFFGGLFVWQMIAAFIGLGGGEGELDGADAGEADMDAGDADADFDGDADEPDAAETTASFTLISIRSLITFFTMFSVAGALLLDNGRSIPSAMTFSTMWGLVGMFVIAGLIYLLRKLTATGTMDLGTAVGTPGTVYLDIPRDGWGEVRVMVSGVVSYIKARTVDGKPLKSGTPVAVVRRLGTRLEVQPSKFEE